MPPTVDWQGTSSPLNSRPATLRPVAFAMRNTLRLLALVG